MLLGSLALTSVDCSPLSASFSDSRTDRLRARTTPCVRARFGPFGRIHFRSPENCFLVTLFGHLLLEFVPSRAAPSPVPDTDARKQLLRQRNVLQSQLTASEDLAGRGVGDDHQPQLLSPPLLQRFCRDRRTASRRRPQEVASSTTKPLASTNRLGDFCP